MTAAAAMAVGATPRPYDLRFRQHGNVVGVTPETNEGDQWLSGNVQAEGWQWMGPTLYIDWRFAEELRQGAREDGLRTN